eukprot:jgi/Psemu1/302242/fgenesh1_kg.63_\
MIYGLRTQQILRLPPLNNCRLSPSAVGLGSCNIPHVPEQYKQSSNINAHPSRTSDPTGRHASSFSSSCLFKVCRDRIARLRDNV